MLSQQEVSAIINQLFSGLKPLFPVYKVVSPLIPGPMLLETVQD